MAKNKIRRFKEMKEWDNVFEPSLDPKNETPFHLKGKWNKEYFKNQNPIVVELGCGKGEYSIGMAKKYPDKNFIGVDIKGARIWVGAKEAVENKIENVAFLRIKIDFLTDYFEQNEIDEIWLTFSDPQPNKPRKRLTSELFIKRYRCVLKPNGFIHLKTDSDLLFESTLEEIEIHQYNCIESTWDLYNTIEFKSEEEKEIFKIKTHYEQLFSAKGAIIKYCKFQV